MPRYLYSSILTYIPKFFVEAEVRNLFYSHVFLVLADTLEVWVPLGFYNVISLLPTQPKPVRKDHCVLNFSNANIVLASIMLAHVSSL